MPSRWLAAAFAMAAAAAVASGCLGGATDAAHSAGRKDAWPHEDDYVGPLEPYGRVLAKRPIELASTGCREGGPHSLSNPTGPLPDPWVPRDVRAYLGNGVVPRLESVLDDNITGIYHAVIVCDTWAIHGQAGGPFVWGFIGTQVEAPRFDSGGADVHYLIHTLTVPTEELQEFLVGLGFSATLGRGLIEEEGPLHRTVLQDDQRGTFEAWMRMNPDRPKEPGTVRLWMLTENWDGSWSPKSLDLVDSPGEHWVAEGYALARTTGAAWQEQPVIQELTASLLFTDFDRTLTFGPAPDVRISQPWTP